MRNNFILVFILRIFLSAVFFFSALTKCIDLSEFELYLYQLPLLTWNWSLVLSRLIISVEFCIAIFYLLNIYTRRNAFITLIVLTAFSVYLSLLLLNGTPRENCYCFGNVLQMDANRSLIKNAVLIILTLFVWRNNQNRVLKRKWFPIVLAVLPLWASLIVFPPEFLLKNYYKEKNIPAGFINPELFRSAVVNGDPGNVMGKERKLLCFFSMGCKYCHRAAKRISTMNNKYPGNNTIVYIFYGLPENLNSFWDNSESDQLPYYIVQSSLFFHYSGKSLPAIFLVKNDSVVRKYNYQSFDEKEILLFFRDVEK